jgi:hypothetical protein
MMMPLPGHDSMTATLSEQPVSFLSPATDDGATSPNPCPPGEGHPTSEWARFYVEKLGFKVVLLKPGTKEPFTRGWNKAGGWFDDPALAESQCRAMPDCGLGMVLKPSGIVVLDVDMPDWASLALKAVGLDLTALLGTGIAILGNPHHEKRIFRAPAVELSLVSGAKPGSLCCG